MADTEESLSLLFISQYFPPETGAAPTRVDALTKRWANEGHDVTVLTSAPDYPEGEIYNGFDNSWLQHEVHNGVDVFYTKTYPASNSGFLHRSLKFVWFMFAAIFASFWLRTPDVVISTSPQPFTGVSGWVIARLRKAAFVFEVRDLWPESITALSDLDNRILISSLDTLINFIYRRADRVVVVTPGFVPVLIDAGVDEDDIWFHPNGVEPEFFVRSGDSWAIDKEVRNRLNSRFVVSYIGTIGRAHGLEIVLDAAEKLKERDDADEILFNFVGTGAEKAYLERRAKERDLDNVQFLGRLPKTEVPEIYELSDVALVHLRDEPLFESAMPSKMFEAMASGTPIVMGVRGEASRIVRKGDVGTPFEPENASELLRALLRYVDEEELRSHHGSTAMEFVRENYSWDSIVGDYLVNIKLLR